MSQYDLWFFAAMCIAYGYLLGAMHACHAWHKSIREERDRALKRFSDAVDKVGF